MAFVRGLGIYLPEHCIEAADIAAASGLTVAAVQDELGVSRKTIPGPDDHTAMMALQAAHSALDDAGTNARTLDLVICTAGVQRDYPGMACGLQMVDDLGAARAYGFDLGHGSGGSILALSLADKLLRSDPDLTAALIVGSYRDGDLVDYADPQARSLLCLAAGAGAAVLSADGPGHEIRGSAFLARGHKRGQAHIPVGGTRAPLSADNIARYHLHAPAGDDFSEGTAESAAALLAEVIQAAVARSQARMSDVAYIALPHMPRRTHYSLLAALNLPPDHSIYLSDYGHIGPIDALLSLDLARAAGRVNAGDLVVAAAAAANGVADAVCLMWGDA